MKPNSGPINSLNPRIMYVLFTYNRPHILQQCLSTLLHPEGLMPNRMLILDDGSDPALKRALTIFQLSNAAFPIDVLSMGKNVGYGTIAEMAFQLIEAYNPQYLYFIESDYIFSKNGLKIVQELFDTNEYAKQAAGFSGYDNPDFYDPAKYDKMFREVILLDCESDTLQRDIFMKPFKQETSFGPIEMEFTSNSCGTMYLNWAKIQEIRRCLPTDYARWMGRITDKYKSGRRCLSDGAMSHGLSWLWNEWAKIVGVDRSKYGPIINIKPSVANHINGGIDSINGRIVPEGSTFVGSPSWKQE